VRREVPYETLKTSLAPGERVLFVTDGLPEALTPSDEPLGYERLLALLKPAAATPGLFLDPFLEAVRAATSAALTDDWTALLLERPQEASQNLLKPSA
jgi:serine phosphatase RsbU (regulator of sigma subunit)